MQIVVKLDIARVVVTLHQRFEKRALVLTRRDVMVSLIRGVTLLDEFVVPYRCIFLKAPNFDV